MSVRQKSPLVVVVDDDESLRNALQDLVEADGQSSLGFASAEDFLDSPSGRNAACLIVDVRMPGMSGLELQARLRAEGSRMPIIFITAHGDAEMRALAVRDGAVAFLPKPFDDSALLEIVHAALER
jgi:FixJ family two-component response regulator